MTTRTCYTENTAHGTMLVDYRTGLTIRKATDEEHAESDAAAESDCGRGLITVDVDDADDAAIS